MAPTYLLSVERDQAWLTLSGELGPDQAHRLRWRLAEAEHLGRRGVFVDAFGVTHLDPACLRVLADALRRLPAAGRRCELAATSIAVRLAAAREGLDLAPRPVAVGTQPPAPARSRRPRPEASPTEII